MKLLHGTKNIVKKSISKMSLYQLQELATRQQEQIECTQRLLASKEQHLHYLSNKMHDAQQLQLQQQQQHHHHQRPPLFDYDQNLNHFKEKITLQEAKLQKLRMLQGQIQKHRYANTNVCSELETLKLLFKEKERELSVATNKIETLTRQLDEIKNGNISSLTNNNNVNGSFGSNIYNNNNNNKHSMDLENLRQELLFKSKILRQNEEELVYKRNLLYKRKCDMLKVDQRINDLQSRLARKKQLNQQQQQFQIQQNQQQQQQQMSSTIQNSQNFFRNNTENGNIHLMMMNHNKNNQNHENSFVTKSFLRSSIGHSVGNKMILNNSNRQNQNTNTVSAANMSNVATVEPLHRFKIDDPKYQTLPYNTKLLQASKLKNNNISLINNNNNINQTTTKLSGVSDDNVGSDNANIMMLNEYGNNNNSKFLRHLHHCDNNIMKENNNIINSDPKKNDISLIINNSNLHHHHHHQTSNIGLINKSNDSNNNSLEERPSPSGSSGSSDRISSSLTTYSYNSNNNNNNEKSNYDEMKSYHQNNSNNNNNNSKDLNKSHFISSSSSNEEENLLFPHRFVPNSTLSITKTSTNSSSLPQSLSNETELNCFDSSSSNNNSQKGKPSVPVKPIATKTTTTNNNNNNNNNNGNNILQQKDPSQLDNNKIQNDTTAFTQENQLNDEVDEGIIHDKHHHQQQQRTSVSEIVNKLNNLTSGKDDQQQSWEKIKRRPVFPSNEMERELEKTSDDHLVNDDINNNNNRNQNDCKSNDLEMCHKTDTVLSSSKPTNENSLNNNNETKLIEENQIKKDDSINESASNNSSVTSNPESNETKSSKLQNPKRIKGNLKNKEQTNNNRQNNNKIGLGRRVSFDPLALLLDASLEGELELVKKTANQVPNPSAANDEGITALHNATCAGHFEIVKYLVEIGCDVNVQDSDGWTPLHCAASCNNLTMIKFLVKSGACIFATTFSDQETAAEKCEEDEEGFDGCSQYLFGIQEKLGLLNNGIVYALYDYVAQNDDELSFNEGDQLKVLQKGDEREKEWWWSKSTTTDNNKNSKEDTKEGYIPRNLIGLSARIKPKQDSNPK